MKAYERNLGMAWPAVLVIAALVAFGLYFFFRSMDQMREMEREAAAPPPAAKAPAAPPGPAEAAYALRLTDLSGRTVSLEEFRGRPVFLTFWATWCRYCTMQMPSIQKLQESVADEGVAFLMVSSENGAQVKSFLDKHRYTLPFLLQTGPLPSVYRTNGIPATFILDKNGEVARKQTGAMNWDDDAVRKLLRDLASS